MAVRGRKPKPTALKVLEGNPGKRPLNEKEPQPKRQAPRCPSWLEPEAKKEWKRMAKTLEAIGVLTQVDKAAFAGYCQAYAFIFYPSYVFGMSIYHSKTQVSQGL
jgi:phage terminase small subunit